ncbi:MAG TPA: hypothetical protein VJ464_18030 [Blastocatellia bacterium]|nr:hypothetical protein [Blastocatellia bacterium]
MQRIFRASCVVFFVIGVVSLSLAWRKREADRGADVEPSRSFVAVYYIAHTTPDGQQTITSWRTRYVKANGEFRVVMHGTDKAAAFAYDAEGTSGTSSSVLAGMNEGVFVKPAGSDERKALSTPAAEKSWDASVPERLNRQFHSHAFLRNHPAFVRMDKFLGYDTYVMKTVADGYWVEQSFSPVIGRFPLRSVTHELDGNEFTAEVVKIDFREVPDNLNDDIKALPHTGHLGDKAPAKQ